ncbi:MAG: TonB-dependent receptor [Tannerellaceae bacterium]|jgi:TonB-linked SusC/RagA family outer membrane protein|nr:TonB-dependent receptor [Tannerellaceae bacterium]
MKKLTYLLLCLFLGIGLVTAQTTQVTGAVTSADDGEPIIGASVIVKGTTTGTVTDIDGNFSLSVPSSSKTLVVSYVGMVSKEIPVQSTVNVELESDVQKLGEIIVTGYGVTRKAAFTGAAQVVDAGQITKSTDADPIRSLQGSVAGFQMSAETGQPGGFNKVMIRGLGSMNSGTDPLYVIDGVPMTTGRFGMRKGEDATVNPLAGLNTSDIESVSILKDATATSIYGARASNGVIVITTKKGKSGKTKINFSAKVGTTKTPQRNDYRMLNSTEWYDFMTQLLGNSKFIEKGNLSEAKEYITSPDGLGINVDPKADTDWYDAVTRSGFTQDYNLDLSGGNEKTKFFISGGYYDEESIVIGKDFQRFSGRLNLENEISKYTSFGINTFVSYSKMNYGAGGGYFSDPITQAYTQLPVQPIYKADGSWNMNTNNKYNPVAQRSKYGDKHISKQIKANVSPWLKVNFLDYFTYISRYGIDFQNIKEFGLWSMLQPQGRDMNMMGEEGNNYLTLWTWTNTLNWIRSFGSHNVNILLGQEMQKAHMDNAYLEGKNYPTDIVYTVENAATPSDASTYYRNYALSSFFANAEYDYKDTYYLSGSLRRDGSSKFGKNNKWGTFWSVGAKYRIINESFMEPASNWLSNLTFRASYGTTGNQEINTGDSSRDWYPQKGLYGFGYNYLQMPGMIPIQVVNPDLKWEQTGKFNVGIELGLFSKVSLDVDYYINRTTNMLFNVPLSRTTGYAQILQNVGEMENKGIELLIGYQPVNTRNFSWDMSLNLTHNKNKIVRLSTDLPIEGTYTIREAGRPYHTFKMKEYAGVDAETGKQLWYKGEKGSETTTDYNEAGKRYLGTSDPKVYGGFTNNFRLFDFDLSVQLFYSLGNKVFNAAARYDENIGDPWGNTTKYVYDNMWRNPGDITNVPAPINGAVTAYSSRFLMDGSYIKLQNIQLGYNLSKKLVESIKLDGVRVYFSAENLATWSLGDDFRGLNPEAPADGILWWSFPLSRKIMFGVNINF